MKKYVYIIINKKEIVINFYINGNIKNEGKLEKNKNLNSESIYYEIVEDN